METLSPGAILNIMELRIAFKTRPTPGKASAEQEEAGDEGEETEGSNEEYDDSYSSIRAILEQMQIRQTQHSDALPGIQDTLQRQELMLTRIMGTFFQTKARAEVVVERADRHSRDIILELVFPQLETKSLVFVKPVDDGHRPLIYLSLSWPPF
ncbi:hypothetical protein M9H77_29717 [Catharanthus roseus]|uniref:Uncharacterized protein n=1 Tax=Catharanthus roseus TaxID=4058 RepID=A0ACB9ZW98_CATRO|nr:hypothetical protein M9H77_29717 [Catharanthus roseus]